MEILRSFGVLLLAQFAGEVMHRALHLPLPGPALGMALLAAVLLLRKRQPSPALTSTANGLLSWLGLLFVPAGVGIVTNIGLIGQSFVPIVVSLVVSTMLTIAVVAFVMQAMDRRPSRTQTPPESPQ
jgi:holin-like protein